MEIKSWEYLDPIDSLAHYGVLGQKWGVRRYQNYDGTLKRSRPDTINERGYRQLTTGRTKEFAKSAGTVAAMYSAMVAIDVVAPQLATPIIISDIIYNKGMRAKTLMTNFEAKDGPRETVKDFKKMRKESPEDSLKQVNIKYPSLGSGCEVNCASCAVAMDLRKKGYDVRARRQNMGTNLNSIAQIYGSKVTDIPKPVKNKDPQAVYEQVYKTIASENKGNSSGVFGMEWKYGHSGHAIYYECKNGKVEFYDGQTGKKGADLDSYFVKAKSDSFSYVRTDNKKPKNDINQYVVSRKDEEKERR